MSFELLTLPTGAIADPLTLDHGLASVALILQNLSQDQDRFYSIIHTAFGNAFDATVAETIRAQWATGDFSQLPSITVQNLGNSGIFGAYASSTNRIYISQTLIDTGDATTLSAVLLEEIGHFLDAQINSSDTPGDEGQLFSALVRGESLTAAEIAAIQSENDTGTITVEGQAVSVEMAFGTATNFAVGNSPYSVTVGDFNGDGHLDLVTANPSSNSVSVLLGKGAGSFEPATNFTVGNSPVSVTVGDFDDDGDLDLVTANQNSNNVSVLFNNGKGVFFPIANFTVGSNSKFVTVGDFNDDGKLDLAVATSFGVSVLLGKGAGDFNSAVNFIGGYFPIRSVTVGDFNGDGKSDLVLVNEGVNRISVLLGDGTGNFGTAKNFTVGKYPNSVTVGDFNGDGKSDLAVANSGSYGVSVLLGEGTGNFGAARNFTVGGSPNSLTVGDFNGDGKSDLAVGKFLGDTVSVLLGDGTGGFGAATNFSAGGRPLSVAVGDFNGDGKSDLVTANNVNNNVSVLLNTTPTITIAPGTNPVEGGGTVGTFLITLDTPAPTGGLVVNFNTTGSTATIPTDYTLTAGENINQVTANTFTIAAGATTATLNVVAASDAVTDPNETVKVNLTSRADYILGYNSSAGFNPAINLAGVETPYSVTVGDFNGDGKSDLVTANGYKVSVLLGYGTGGFRAPTDFTAANGSPISVTVGDFNGDGKSDLAVVNLLNDSVSVRLGDGKGSFGTPTNFTVGGNPFSVAEGDFNDDGKSDLVTADVNGNTVSVLFGTGTGSFHPATNFSVGNGPVSVAVGDFNGDGKSDLVTANARGNNVSVRFRTLTGSFDPPTNLSVGINPYSVAVGDFNGDGNSDLVTANRGSNHVSVLLGSSTGAFSAAQTFAVRSGPRSVTVGDFNRDGKSDLAVANFNSHTVSVLLGDGTGIFGTATNFAVGGGPFSVTVGDFNGDGKSDLATANPSNGGSISILLNADPTATVTITDVPPPSLSIDDVTFTEGKSGTTDFTFTVHLSRAASTNVSVDYAITSGTATAGIDYFLPIPTGTLTFNPGETSKTITVPVNGDNMVELDETFFVNLSNLQGNGSNVTLADAQGQGTITNDDSASIKINNVGVNEENSGTSDEAVFFVTLSNPVDTAITLNYATADGTATIADHDYIALDTTPLTFNAGETFKTIPVRVNGDTKVENNETFFLNLSNLNPNGRNVTLANNQGKGTIFNDDSASISINNMTVTEGNSDPTNATFTVTLSSPVSTSVSVNYATADGVAKSLNNDYIPIASTTLTFNPGETSKTITVQVNGDTQVEIDETLLVNLSNLQTNSNNVTLTDNQGQAIILNDDNTGAIIGTPRKESLNGTSQDDTIIGLDGSDTLTGGAGNDQFVYQNKKDAWDVITDFTVGQDKIVLTALLNSLAYKGTNPIADNYVKFGIMGSDTLIRIDPDGNGILSPISFITVQNVSLTNLNNPSNFVF